MHLCYHLLNKSFLSLLLATYGWKLLKNGLWRYIINPFFLLLQLEEKLLLEEDFLNLLMNPLKLIKLKIGK